MWRKKLNDTLAHIIGRENRENRFDQDPDLRDEEIIKKRKIREQLERKTNHAFP